MQASAHPYFLSLFKQAFQKCFGTELSDVLPSETECKHFSNQILEATGLVIGAKSLKNYSLYVRAPDEAKPEKPSLATLDTLARYVLNAPYTSETERKAREAHYPYWFQYRNEKSRNEAVATQPAGTVLTRTRTPRKPKRKMVLVTTVVFVAALLIACLFLRRRTESFSDNFASVAVDSLQAHGWWVRAEDKDWWEKRGQSPSRLTLFTLPGDSWADSLHTPLVKNLLLHKLASDCFTAEVHLEDFMPAKRWQQAGILLLEDTGFTGRSLRLSIAYNDFFGGYAKPKEVILQGIAVDGKQAANPEEIIHLPLFNVSPGQDSLVAHNLRRSAVRIEKTGNRFRFLYATGQTGNFAYKEALSKELAISPRYLGLFASGGFVDGVTAVPVRIRYFNLTDVPCK